MKMKYTNMKKGLAAALLVGGAFVLFPTSQDVEAQAIGLRKLDQMLTSTPKVVARGQKVYATQCAECHGDAGAGNGPLAGNFEPAPAGFKTGAFKYGGGPIQLFNAISRGELVGATAGSAEGEEPVVAPIAAIAHPAFPTLAYQDRWAVSHYVRTLSNTQGLTDNAAALEMAKYEAVNGVCNPSLKGSIAAKVKPTGADQIAKGKELYASSCSACHGTAGAGDGAAAGALKPPPRDFTSKDQKWTNGTSPLAVFNTLAKGIPGTSMAAYTSFSEADRWAMTHYLRSLVPASALQSATEKEVMDVCRSLSEPPKPESISVAKAMKALAADYGNQRDVEIAAYGPAIVHKDANARLGQAMYTQSCSGCHGTAGAGTKAHGPYGSYPPYLYVQVGRLTPAMAGGSTQEFAARSIGGLHATLPDMSAASQMSADEWKGLHVFVARFDGGGDVITADQLPVNVIPTAPEGTQEGDKPAPAPEKAAVKPAVGGGK